jgi:hypothetical protein
MTTGSIDSRVGGRAETEDELVLRRERIDFGKVLLHKEMNPQPFSPQVGFIYRIRGLFFFKGFCLEIYP